MQQSWIHSHHSTIRACCESNKDVAKKNTLQKQSIIAELLGSWKKIPTYDILRVCLRQLLQQ